MNNEIGTTHIYPPVTIDIDGVTYMKVDEIKSETSEEIIEQLKIDLAAVRYENKTSQKYIEHLVKPKTSIEDFQIHVVLQRIIDLINSGDNEKVIETVTKTFNDQEEQINDLFLQCDELKMQLFNLKAEMVDMDNTIVSKTITIHRLNERVERYENELLVMQNDLCTAQEQQVELQHNNELLQKRRDTYRQEVEEKLDMVEDALSLIDTSELVDSVDDALKTLHNKSSTDFCTSCNKNKNKNIMDKLHYIEDSNTIFNPIYNIHYCNSGVGIIFYDPTKDTGNFREALTVHKYYDTFEKCIDAEYDRLLEREKEEDADDGDENNFNALCRDIYETYHGMQYATEFDPWGDNSLLVDIVDIVMKNSDVAFEVSKGDTNIYDAMISYVVNHGHGMLKK